MEKDIFDLIPDFDLILEKSAFRDLNPEQKEVIRGYFSEEEYAKLREMIRISKQYNLAGKPTLKPNPAVKERIFENLAPKPPRAARVISDVLNYRIPLYQVGLAASVLLIFFFYFMLRTESSLRQTILTDTVFKERVISQRDTVWIEKPFLRDRSTERSAHVNHETREPVLTGASPEKGGLGSVPVSIYARRQMKDALSRISLLAATPHENSISTDSLLLRLVTAVY